MTKVERYSDKSGRMLKEDSTNINIADMWDSLWSRVEDALRSINHVSGHVRDGISYRFFYDVTITNGETENIQIKTGEDDIYVTGIIVVPEAELFTENFIESPTITDGTTEIGTNNADRRSSNTSTVTVYSDPTSVSGGTTFESIYMPGETGVGQQRRGDRYQGTIEWILKPNTDYVLQIINNGAGASDLHLEMHWYEL